MRYPRNQKAGSGSSEFSRERGRARLGTVKWARLGTTEKSQSISFLRKGEVLAYVGRIHNLKDLKSR